MVDFAHSWAEKCLDKIDEDEDTWWRFALVGGALLCFAGTIALTGILYGFFASAPCHLNKFLISFNLALCIVITIVSILPQVQEANSRSGLSQTSVVALYASYLIFSAITNEPTADDDEMAACNPLVDRQGTQTAAIIIGSCFTFLAIAYSTSRAATKSSALIGTSSDYAPVPDGSAGDTNRRETLLAAVESG